MATRYTQKMIEAALEEVHIEPEQGRVTSTEAARILTWRAKKEYKIQHQYTANAVRKHKEKLDSQPKIHPDGTVNPRMNTYDVHKVFALDIAPMRTNAGNKHAALKGIDKIRR